MILFYFSVFRSPPGLDVCLFVSLAQNAHVVGARPRLPVVPLPEILRPLRESSGEERMRGGGGAVHLHILCRRMQDIDKYVIYEID